MKHLKSILLFLILSTIALTFDSCQLESNEISDLENEAQTMEELELVQVNINGEDILFKEMENGDYLIGDQVFPQVIFNSDEEENASTRVQGVGRIGKRWSNNTVPYYIESGNVNDIEQAIRHVELFTNLRFEETDGSDPYALFFYDYGNSNCSATVGYINEAEHSNYIFVGGCNTTGSIIHEIGHILGLWHEQSRSDRDDYIDVLFDNVITTEFYQFMTYDAAGNDGEEYTDFDFNSIMLYESYALSTNGKPTITKLDGTTFDNNNSGFSYLDMLGLDAMYPEITAKTFSIQGGNGLYVCSENGKKPITCNRSAVGSWEKFQIVPTDMETFALIANNGKYLNYDDKTNTFTFSTTGIANATNFTISEYSYGQSNHFIASWYATIKPVDGNFQGWRIDESNNGTIEIGYSSEFRIELLD